MAKKCILERNKRRKELVTKYFFTRKILTAKLKKTNNFEEKLHLNETLQKLPRNSAQTRLRNRCWKTGRARGVYNFFGLCRNAFREMAHDCYLPGVIKASW